MSELFVEIGTEELPAHAVGPAAEALAAGLVKLLGPIRHGAVRTFGTPRRLAVAIADVDPARPAVDRVVTGPPVAQAFPNGQPGPVAERFAQARGVAVEQLLHVDTPKGKVIGVRRVEGGEPTAEVVAKGLEDVVLAISFKKSMKWEASGRKFARPIHSVCAVYAERVIETSVLGVFTSGNSHGHWLWSPEPFAVTDSVQWQAALRERWVLPDVAERRERVLEQLASLAVARGADVSFDPELVDEVVQLVEWPRTIVSHFAESLLELPPRLLVESMKKNQRYFPLTRDGVLTNEFLVVTNNPYGDDDLIADGNARVLGARFYDAKFFYAEDRKKSLAEHGEKLRGMMWIRGLGTMAERQAALADAAAGVARLLDVSEAQARAAGALSKSDLTTQMVGEFPELQGHVGRLLAALEGAPGDVALAIEEQYLPRFAGDALPTSGPGRALALAERLTLLARAFAAGLAPKGSADPLGLRRAANGVVAIVLDVGWRGALADLFAAAGVGGGDDLHEFVLARLRATLQEDAPVDVVDAVLAAPADLSAGAGAADLVGVAERVRALVELGETGAFGPIRKTFRRAAGLVKGMSYAGFDAAVLTHPSEQALVRLLGKSFPSVLDVRELVAMLAEFRPLVDDLFDQVLVMCEDETLRRNRLALLTAIRLRFDTLADFTRLSGD